MFARFGRYGGQTNGTFRADLLDLFDGPDGRVIGHHHNSGERDGRRLDTDCCIVFDIVAGHVASGHECFADLANWDAFWA